MRFQAYPFLDSVGWDSLVQQPLEAYPFEGGGQDFGLTNYDRREEVCSGLKEFGNEEGDGHGHVIIKEKQKQI